MVSVTEMSIETNLFSICNKNLTLYLGMQNYNIDPASSVG